MKSKSAVDSVIELKKLRYKSRAFALYRKYIKERGSIQVHSSMFQNYNKALQKINKILINV